MINIVLVGISHHTAPVEVREKFSFDDSSLKEALTKLKEKDGIEECLVLSTCNRTEIYAVTDSLDTCIDSIKRFLESNYKFYEKDLAQYFYTLTNKLAVKHLFKVTSSLDSMVVGEPQIFGQVKKSYKEAFDSKSLGIILHRLFQTAFFAAKKVRTETNIGSQAVSISYLAVELSKRIFDDLENRKVLLIGTGEMSELAAKNLINANIKDVFIASRNFDNARSMAERLRAEAINIEEIYYRISEVDILITATGSNDFIIKSDHIDQAMKLRKNEPMFLIDIAVPRDIDPRVNKLSGVYLYDIDDLQEVSQQNIHSRNESKEEAEEILSDLIKSYLSWAESLKVLPTIIDLQRKADLVKSTELERAYNKSQNLNSHDKEIINTLVNRVVDKMLHEPIVNLKKEASSPLGSIYADTVKRLYGLDNNLKIAEDIEDEIEDWN